AERAQSFADLAPKVQQVFQLILDKEGVPPEAYLPMDQAVAKVLDEWLYKGAWEEALHPREHGRFADKPGEEVAHAAERAGHAAEGAAQEPKLPPASADLAKFGVPQLVVARIHDLGLDTNLKGRRKRSRLALHLLGKFEDTKEKYTIPTGKK